MSIEMVALDFFFSFFSFFLSWYPIHVTSPEGRRGQGRACTNTPSRVIGDKWSRPPPLHLYPTTCLVIICSSDTDHTFSLQNTSSLSLRAHNMERTQRSRVHGERGLEGRLILFPCSWFLGQNDLYLSWERKSGLNSPLLSPHLPRRTLT